MALYKFNPDDIFTNTLEAYPEFSFYIHSGTVHFDSLPHREGVNADVPSGFTSLYELNNDKPAAQCIYPTMIKEGFRNSFKIYSNAQHDVFFNYDGEDLTGSYNISASITRDHYAANGTRPKIAALRNTFDEYRFISPHYAFISDFGDKSTQEMSVISIPSIFYGSRIKKGSVKLDYYVSGSLIGTLEDEGFKGELVQTGPTGSVGSGSIAGVVLYKEGAIILTGSWTIEDSGITYKGSSATGEKWTNFGDGLHKTLGASDMHIASASFNIAYQGVTHTNTMTMMARANYNELNHSNNPTFMQNKSPYNYAFSPSSSYMYKDPVVFPKNITDTALTDVIPEPQKETYISKVAIYDKDKNLIGFAKVATPVRKTEDRQYLFKLKLDI
jgi:hypothetical protein